MKLGKHERFLDSMVDQKRRLNFAQMKTVHNTAELVELNYTKKYKSNCNPKYWPMHKISVTGQDWPKGFLLFCMKFFNFWAFYKTF